ncbi:MAG: type II toxin-antitoxin system prevent-host-death family antitoxin [Deltaproteobacteria bacterium]|nr:MAG: type II toxin-antitoxin system prevent-host-death family antitoxin [Deltaproteobacteria bacterium]PIE72999.1 MAG: type II toxin-antitoxin system prevent-host-death family antitoxin [Deltaproteobacteria bacterium]
MIENHWQLQEAKNKFSSLVNQAQQIGPQVVTKHGQVAVVVISAEEYNKLTKPKKNIVQFFQESPLAQEDISFERSKEKPREIIL